MSVTLVTVLIGVAMAVGIVGVVLPFLPGLGLVLAAGILYGFVVGWNAFGLIAVLIMVVLLSLGMAAKFVLADKSAQRGGATRQSLIIAAVGAVVGFFVIPVLGVVVGGAVALVGAEYRRMGDWSAAWRSSKTTMIGVGTGVFVEMFAGIAMALTWGVWVVFG